MTPHVIDVNDCGGGRSVDAVLRAQADKPRSGPG
jgi:hypothetical protein